MKNKLIDFTSPVMLYRLKQLSWRKELLARAIGLKPKEHPRIIDATAGLGRDSFILAALGYEITLIERSPIVFSLLKEALHQAEQYPLTQSICQRLTLIHADSVEWLQSEKAEVVYLDPMFPPKKKNAAVKKEMTILQDLVGKDIDNEGLFAVARTCATRRVVVKRSRFAAEIATIKPSFSLIGKSSRFDIYL
jgi:16S rRNA (guanine1516-N2)-methyltransferase